MGSAGTGNPGPGVTCVVGFLDERPVLLGHQGGLAALVTCRAGWWWGASVVPMGRILLRSRHVDWFFVNSEMWEEILKGKRGLGCMHLNGPVTRREVL